MQGETFIVPNTFVPPKRFSRFKIVAGCDQSYDNGWLITIYSDANQAGFFVPGHANNAR